MSSLFDSAILQACARVPIRPALFYPLDQVCRRLVQLSYLRIRPSGSVRKHGSLRIYTDIHLCANKSLQFKEDVQAPKNVAILDEL